MRPIHVLPPLALAVSCGAPRTLDGGCGKDLTAGGWVADGQALPILDGMPRMPCAIRGIVYEQLLTGVDSEGNTGQETAPFAVAALSEAPVPEGFPDLFGAKDRCFRNIEDHDIRGEVDLGRGIELGIGRDSLLLKPRPNWAPGDFLYIYDPPSSRILTRNLQVQPCPSTASRRR